MVTSVCILAQTVARTVVTVLPDPGCYGPARVRLPLNLLRDVDCRNATSQGSERNRVRGAYNRAEHLLERREMMQRWANYLDALATGGKVLPFRAA